MHVSFILDETGSMQSCKEQTISGFNEYIETLRSDDDAKKMCFTLTKFNSSIGARVIYDAVNLMDVDKLDNSNYVPKSTTPLYDAIGTTIKSIGKKKKVLVIIQTDGLENDSREFTQKDIFDMIKKKKKDGWTFVFLGADQDAYAASAKLGVDAGNTMSYGSSKTSAAFAATARGTVSYARSKGQQTSSFVTDLNQDKEAR